MKPPAFQFYADDFLAGTLDLTQAEVGAYIRLLCHQWNRGSIPVDTEKQQRLAGGSVSVDVLAKFRLTEDGKMVNDRLEVERQKQESYREKQRQKGFASAKARQNQPRLSRGSTEPPTAVEIRLQPEGNSPSPSPSPSPLVLEREREQPAREIPSLQAVLFQASKIGLAEWRATDWWNEMEAAGWIDYLKRPIIRWEPALQRVAIKWRSDGAPATKPSGTPARPGPNGRPYPVKIDHTKGF